MTSRFGTLKKKTRPYEHGKLNIKLPNEEYRILAMQDTELQDAELVFFLFENPNFPLSLLKNLIYDENKPQEVFFKNGVLKNFAKFTGKQTFKRYSGTDIFL